MIALVAERGSPALKRRCNVLALLPIITPPFVVGLGLILLFGRAGIVNQVLESAFGVTPSRWFYGLLGVWLAQLFAFTPIAFMIMRGVVAGIGPSLEEAAQTLRADRRTTFLTVTLPLLKPGLANAFLVGFIESIADFGNPIVVGGQFSVLSTDVFFAIVGAQFDQGRAASLALDPVALRARASSCCSAACSARHGFTTVTGKGDGGLPMPLPDGVRRVVLGDRRCPGSRSRSSSTCSPSPAASCRPGAATTRRRCATSSPPSTLQRGSADVGGGLVWAGTAWNSLFTTLKLAALAAPICAALGLLIAWLLARTAFRGQAPVRVRRAAGVRDSRHRARRELHPRLQRAAVRAHRHRAHHRALLRVPQPAGRRARRHRGVPADRPLARRGLDDAARATATTLRRVVLPLLKPALVAALVYSFVRSMTTVSAVIFLVTAENELATTYIIGRVGNGDYGVALAYCTVLIAADVARRSR